MKMLAVICMLFGVAIPASADGVRQFRSPRNAVVVRPAFHGHNNFAFRQRHHHGVQQFQNYGYQQFSQPVYAQQFVQSYAAPQIQCVTTPPCYTQPVCEQQFHIMQNYAQPFVQNYGYAQQFGYRQRFSQPIYNQRAFIGVGHGLDLNVGRVRLRF